MSINASLIAEMIAFALFVWLTMKYIWPPIVNAMAEREEKIADGLAASERGRHELELAQERVSELLKEARQNANEIMEQANKRSNEIIDEARNSARDEGERQLAAARAQIEQELSQAKRDLRANVVDLALKGATQVLGREVDAKAHNDLLEDLAKQL